MKTVTSALACAAIAAFAVAGLVPGEAAAQARKPRAGCEAAAALKLVGEAPPADAKVRRLTGARVVRRVEPGQSVTLDYRPDRVTLEIASGRIVATNCG